MEYHIAKTGKDCNEGSYQSPFLSISRAAEIAEAGDRIVVHDKLKKENMYDDTIIIFTSDHGEMLGDYEALYKGDQPFYSLIHIPFIVKPAKGTDIPHKIEDPMSNADVLPTLFGMLGIEKPENIQGVDIFKEGKGNMPMSTCYNLLGYNRNISIYDEQYRYTYVTDTEEEELYNQKEDPKEYVNLAKKSEYREICDKMRERVLKKHLKCEIQIYGHYGTW